MKLLAIDFETTGIPYHPDTKPAAQPRAIELAAALVEGGETLREDVWQFNPERALEPIITKITGLTDEDLADAPLWADTWPEIAEAFSAADCLIAHNLPFDAYILAHELRLAGVKDFAWPLHLVCTVQLFEELYGYRPKLIELYRDTTGREYAQTHRALDDVHALIEIIRHAEVEKIIAPVKGQNRVLIPPELRSDHIGCLAAEGA